MSAIKYGRGPTHTGRIQKLPGSKLVISADQAATFTEMWGGQFDQLVTQTPGKDYPHPRFPNLLLYTKEIVEGKLGAGTATLTFKGLDPSLGSGGNGVVIDDGGNTSYPEIDMEVDTDVEEIPIQAHPNFLGLVAAAGTGPSQTAFDSKGLFLGFGPESGGDLAGTESYQVARTVETRHWYSSARSSLPVGVRVGSAFRISLRSSRQGSVWKNTEVLRYSNPNPLIYP